MTAETKTRTITLTGRPPVKIREDEWPIVASAKAWDNQYEFQANRTWRLTVRQHADGRAIVYGVCTSQWEGEHERRGGEILDAGADLAAAIVRVGADTQMPENIVRDCIANLPAEDLTTPAGIRDVPDAIRK